MLVMIYIVVFRVTTPQKLVVGDRRFGEKLLLPSSTAMMYTSFPSE
jgi:hypothetical protein